MLSATLEQTPFLSADFREGARDSKDIQTEMALFALRPATHALSLCVGGWDVVTMGLDGPVLAEPCHIAKPIGSVLLQVHLDEAVLEGRSILEAVKELPGRANIKIVECYLISAPQPFVTSFDAHGLELGQKLCEEDVDLLVVGEATHIHHEHRAHDLVVVVHRYLHVSALPRISRPQIKTTTFAILESELRDNFLTWNDGAIGAFDARITPIRCHWGVPRGQVV